MRQIGLLTSPIYHENIDPLWASLTSKICWNQRLTSTIGDARRSRASGALLTTYPIPKTSFRVIYRDATRFAIKWSSLLTSTAELRASHR